MNLLPDEYSYEPFDPGLAKTTACAVLLANSTRYKLVEHLEERETGYAVEYPYRALVESKYYDFNRSGNDADGNQIFLAIGIIDTEGAAQGDIQTKTDMGGETHYYAITNLNYRESVAIQVLNALITHIPNPIGYTAATIKLLISKAFEFAIEFTNQALSLRVDNAEVDPETGQIVPDSTDIVTALNSIMSKLADINSTENAVKSALDGTTTGGVAAKVNVVADRLNTANTNLGTIGTNISTVGGKVETGDSNIVTALNNITIPDVSDQLRTISDNVSSVKSTVEADKTTDDDTNTMVHGLYYSDIETVKDKIDSVSNKVDSVGDDVDTANTKLDNIKTVVDDIDNKVTPNTES